MGHELRPPEELRSDRSAGNDRKLRRPVGTHFSHVGRPAQPLHLSAAYLQLVRVIVVNLSARRQQKSLVSALALRAMLPSRSRVTRPVLPLEMMAVRPLVA